MGHRIPNHKSKCKNLHGHRYKVEVALKGHVERKKGVSEEGMVFDFGDIKVLLKEEIHTKCDHAFMFYEKDKILLPLAKANNSLKFLPVSFIPTAENISKWIFDLLYKKIQLLSKNKFFLESVKVWETPSSAALISKNDQYENWGRY